MSPPESPGFGHPTQIPPSAFARRHFVGMWVSCAPDTWQMDTSASTQHTPARLLAIPPLSRL